MIAMIRLLAAAATILLSTTSLASDIVLTLRTEQKGQAVTVTVENESLSRVNVERVTLEFNNQSFIHTPAGTIPPKGKSEFLFTAAEPEREGTYPLIAAVRYLNDGFPLSLRHVGLFHYNGAAFNRASCFRGPQTIQETGDVRIDVPLPDKWRLVLPGEIVLEARSAHRDHALFHVRNTVPGFRTTYPVFAYAEDIVDGRHRTDLCSGLLTTNTQVAPPLSRGGLSSPVLMAMAVLFFVLAACAVKRDRGQAVMTALGKYASRMFFVTISYFLLKNIDSWLVHTLDLIGWSPYAYFINIVTDNLQGGNYRHFFGLFIDFYLLACLVLIFPYFYYLERERGLSGDRYASLVKTIASLPAAIGGRAVYWNELSRLGMLTFLLKLFFAPYMVSWAMNGFSAVIAQTASLTWNLFRVNAFLIDLMILVDTLIFATGYLVESKFLKNEIRSVDPTFLGWLVCLWCYPPFNVFSFRPFDYHSLDLAISAPAWLEGVMLCIITLFWGVFAWASVSLCFKASNLTNRGIVMSGPYRFVRHPAYAAKVCIWIIQGVFFSRYGAGILLGFAVIYFLRAWTEERHLSVDPDYCEYREEVRRWFIPGLI